MARPEYYFPRGFLKKFFDKRDYESDGLFSVGKLIKLFADRFHIPYEDTCCNIDVPADERTSLPVRYNGVEAQLEYFNPETGEWTATA